MQSEINLVEINAKKELTSGRLRILSRRLAYLYSLKEPIAYAERYNTNRRLMKYLLHDAKGMARQISQYHNVPDGLLLIWLFINKELHPAIDQARATQKASDAVSNTNEGLPRRIHQRESVNREFLDNEILEPKLSVNAIVILLKTYSHKLAPFFIFMQFYNKLPKGKANNDTYLLYLNQLINDDVTFLDYLENVMLYGVQQIIAFDKPCVLQDFVKRFNNDYQKLLLEKILCLQKQIAVNVQEQDPGCTNERLQSYFNLRIEKILLIIGKILFVSNSPQYIQGYSQTLTPELVSQALYFFKKDEQSQDALRSISGETYQPNNAFLKVCFANVCENKMPELCHHLIEQVRLLFNIISQNLNDNFDEFIKFIKLQGARIDVLSELELLIMLANTMDRLISNMLAVLKASDAIRSIVRTSQPLISIINILLEYLLLRVEVGPLILTKDKSHLDDMQMSHVKEGGATKLSGTTPQMMQTETIILGHQLYKLFSALGIKELSATSSSADPCLSLIQNLRNDWQNSNKFNKAAPLCDPHNSARISASEFGGENGGGSEHMASIEMTNICTT